MLKKRTREKLIHEINVTPLCDVMLVLLIIFMVTTPFIIQGNIKINLPSAKTPSESVPEKHIVISVTSEGRTYLNGAEVSTDLQLKESVKKLLAENLSDRVIIEGDKMSFHGEMVRVMSIAKDAGAEKIALSTIPEGEKEGTTNK